MYKIGWEFEDGSVTGRTLLGILRGGVGCGNPKLKDIPKWWMRVSKIVRCKGPSTVKSLTLEAIPSATQFFMRAYKISHFPGL